VDRCRRAAPKCPPSLERWRANSGDVRLPRPSAAITTISNGIASLAHVKSDEFAKTVIVRVDGKLVMAVLPASYHVDLALLKTAADGEKILLASETDFRDRFPGCEVGAMPPFGQLYHMPVFVDESLKRDKKIAFNAGTPHELIRLSYEDFESLVQPKIARFATTAKAALRP
jgi:Ala-tRNA(Pro) deacylase